MQKKLVEGVDFYIENDLYVFTEYYLLERGYCCGNGCRHCPYEKGEQQKGEQQKGEQQKGEQQKGELKKLESKPDNP